MNEEGKKSYEDAMQKFLTTQVSRAALMRSAGLAAIAAVAVPGIASAATGTGRAPYVEFPQIPSPSLTKSGRYTSEALGDILNIAQTAEYFAVTFLTAATKNATALTKSDPVLLSVLQAILAAEVTHIQVLASLGATPLTTTFTIPDPKALTDFATFWTNVETADTIFIGAYLAAIREAAEVGQPYVAKIAGQFMGVEAEHRVLARNALATLGGDTSHVPPNNKAFETDLFLYVREAAGVLQGLGFVGGTGTPAPFPGLAAATTAAGSTFGKLIQLAPNNAAEGSTAPTLASINGEHR